MEMLHIYTKKILTVSWRRATAETREKKKASTYMACTALNSTMLCNHFLPILTSSKSKDHLPHELPCLRLDKLVAVVAAVVERVALCFVPGSAGEVA